MQDLLQGKRPHQAPYERSPEVVSLQIELARAKFPDGSPLRHVEGASWRELGERLALEYAARKGLGRAMPVVEVSA